MIKKSVAFETLLEADRGVVDNAFLRDRGGVGFRVLEDEDAFTLPEDVPAEGVGAWMREQMWSVSGLMGF